MCSSVGVASFDRDFWAIVDIGFLKRELMSHCRIGFLATLVLASISAVVGGHRHIREREREREIDFEQEI